MIQNIDNIPIDLVYTWVDSSDPIWLKKRSAYYGKLKKSDELRWSDRGEIKSSIASAKLFLPWLNHIYIITDSQSIPMYDNDPRITIIDHKMIFGDKYKSHLPVFNSHAIESHLHQIEGLSEYFICSCDDTFFGAPCSKSDFFGFNRQGILVPKIFITDRNLPVRTESKILKCEPYFAAQINSMYYASLGLNKQAEKGEILHQVKPLSKTICSHGWKISSKILTDTSKNRIRSRSDCNPVDLFSKVGLGIGLAIKGRILSNMYLTWKNDTQSNLGMLHKLNIKRPKLYCINDIGQSNDPSIPRYLIESMPHCTYNNKSKLVPQKALTLNVNRKMMRSSKKNTITTSKSKFKKVGPKLRRL